MASAAVHIPNMREAIAGGAVPGGFAEGRAAFLFPALAYVGARGATHHWAVGVRLIAGGDYVPITDAMLDRPAPDLDGYKAEITVQASQEGGKVRSTVPTYVSRGKNLGKKNATNCVTQALRDALGLYNRQRKGADVTDAGALAAAGAPAGARAATGANGAGVDASANGAGADGADGASADAGADAGADDAGADASADASAGAAPGAVDERPPPMLVKKSGDSRAATLTAATFLRESGVTVQRKLNGVRLVVFATENGRRLARYSRTGADYPGQAQVVAELLPMVAAAPPVQPGEFGTPAAPATESQRRVLAAYGALPGTGGPRPYFDGELYIHGKSLPWISGQARRSDDEGGLEFHVFDVFFPHAKAAGHDMESRHRQAYLDAFFANAAGRAHPHVVRVENFAVASFAEMQKLARGFLEAGYEGAIARKGAAGYQYGYSNYHSANLVKIKPKHDAEFPVVGFTQGTRGKDVGAIIWVCEVPHPVDPRDGAFAVVPNMDYGTRYALFKCLSKEVPGPAGGTTTVFERDVKGLPLTVEYAEISTKTGKPLQAKAVAFRTYESGPASDPVAAVLKGCRAATAARRPAAAL